MNNQDGSMALDTLYGFNFTTYVDADSPSQPLPDTGHSESVTAVSLGVSVGLLTAGALALIMVRRRLARK